MAAFRSQYVSTLEVAQFLGVTQATVINRIQKGTIEAVKIGRSYAIPRTYIQPEQHPYQIHQTEEREYISIMEAARHLGVTRMTIYKRIRKGQLPAKRVGRHFVIAIDDLNAARTHSESVKDCVSLPQYAQQVGMSRVAVWKKVKAGVLPAKRVGGRHFILVESSESQRSASAVDGLNNYRSVRELAQELGISRIAVFKKIQKGQIKALKVGRSYLIPKDDE